MVAKPTSPDAPGAAERASHTRETSQTLDRGLRALALVAAAPGGCTINEIATALGTNRTSAYRLLTTLAEHRLVSRDASGRYRPGAGLLDLAKALAPRLRDVAVPFLQQLAETVGATAHLTIADGEDAVAVAVVEPRATTMHVAYRAGSRHGLDVGAPGVAILAGRPRDADDSAPVRRARSQGYALTRGELQAGAVGLAAPVRTGDLAEEASVGVVAFSDLVVQQAVPQVLAAASAIADALGGLEPS